MNSKWVVHKFGGTSVADAERYRAAAEIVLARAPGERTAVVVSAMSDVTNVLIQSVELAATNDSSYLTKLQELQRRHLERLGALQVLLVRPHRGWFPAVGEGFVLVSEDVSLV